MADEERFHGGHFPKHIVLHAVFWYLRYSLMVDDKACVYVSKRLTCQPITFFFLINPG